MFTIGPTDKILNGEWPESHVLSRLFVCGMNFAKG